MEFLSQENMWQSEASGDHEMTGELSPFSYFVMAVIGRDGRSGPELVRKASDGSSFFWAGAGSHVLRTARRLADEGYLSARSEAAKTRPRTVYALTEKGEAAFRAWQAEPSSFPQIQHEAAIRVWACDLGDPTAVLTSLRALREELPRLQEVIDAYDQEVRDFPDRSRGLRLNQSLARRLIQAHLDWIADVEAELAESALPTTSRKPQQGAAR